jgi:hypothetical protein
MHAERRHDVIGLIDISEEGGGAIRDVGVERSPWLNIVFEIRDERRVQAEAGRKGGFVAEGKRDGPKSRRRCGLSGHDRSRGKLTCPM